MQSGLATSRLALLGFGIVLSFCQATAQTVTVSPVSLSFGNNVVGTVSTTKKVTLKNGQTAALTISSITTDLPDYTETSNCPINPKKLAAGSSCVISVSFKATALGIRAGKLTVTDDASSRSQTVSLTGTGIAPVMVNPVSLAFGNQAVGSASASASVTLTNNQKIGLTINSISASLADYVITTSCPLRTKLPAGASCTISVTFTPAAIGTRPAIVTITDNASNSPQTVGLSGTGVPPVVVSPASLAFGDQIKGTTSPAQSVTLKNNKTTSLTVSAIASSVVDFPVSSNCPISPSTLAAGATCAISVMFSPKTIGARNGTLTVTDNANNSPQTVTLSGNGLTPTLTSIVVTPSGASIAVGANQQFSATGTYSDGSTSALTSSVTWTSSAPSIASVNEAGLASGVAQGTTTIVARSGTVSGSANLSVAPAALVSIGISPVNPSLALGTTQQLKATGTYTDGSTLDLTTSVTWKSVDNAIATVDSEGFASSIAIGGTTIMVSSGSITASTTLTITPAALVSIAVTPALPSIALGTTKQFTATGTFTDHSTQDITQTAQWNCDNTNVATVSNISGSQGRATSVGEGAATISASLSSKTGSTVLTVTAAALVSLSVTPSDPSIAVGSNQQFTATGTFTDGTTQNMTAKVGWTSDTSSVATIDKTGLATSAAAGSANIIATSNSITGSSLLTVTEAQLLSIDITPQSATVPLGASQQFTAVGTYSDGTTQDLTQSAHWSSSDMTVATISNSVPNQGVASTLGTGTTNISISAGSVAASATLLVNAAALVSITISPQAPSIALGTSQQFTATGSYSDGSNMDLTSTVQWSSSASVVAVMSTDSGTAGLATSAGVGAANINASLNSISGTTILTVTGAQLQSISTIPQNADIPLGATQQFTANGTYTDGTSQDITQSVLWTSSQPGIADVNSSGVANAIATGATTIRATSGSLSSSSVLNVTSGAPPPSLPPGPTIPATYFGMHWNSTPTAYASTGFQAYAPTRRLWDAQVSWSQIETSPGTYDWSKLDIRVNDAISHGAGLIYTLGKTPQFYVASANQGDSKCNGGPGQCWPPEDVLSGDDHLKNFIMALINHVGTGKIKYFEGENEPNNAKFFSGTVAQLKQMQIDLYNTVHANDSGAQVLMPPGFHGTGSKDISGMLSAGIGSYADINTFHGKYCTPEDDIANTNSIKSDYSDAGFGSRPLWNTEGGWGNTTNCVDSTNYPAKVARLNLLNWGQGIARYYWYSWDNSSRGQLGSGSTVNASGTAYQQVVGWMVGASMQTPCPANGTVYTCVLARDNGYQAQAVWNTAGTSSYNAPSQYTQYRDLTGSTFTIPTNRVLTIGVNPILLETR